MATLITGLLPLKSMVYGSQSVSMERWLAIRFNVY